MARDDGLSDPLEKFYLEPQTVMIPTLLDWPNTVNQVYHSMGYSIYIGRGEKESSTCLCGLESFHFISAARAEGSLWW